MRQEPRTLAPEGFRPAARKPSRAVEALRGLWHAKRRERGMPARHDFTIDDLAPWLGRLDLISLEGGVARFDVFGTHNSRELGVELTGRTIEALPAEDRDVVRAGIERAMQARTPLFDTVTVVRNQRLRTFDRLVLPLSNDDRTVNKLFVLTDNAQDERQRGGRWVAATSARVHAPYR